jgi:hypothetical protein
LHYERRVALLSSHKEVARKFMASIFNHTAPCAVKRAGIADDIGAGREQSGNQKRGWRDPERPEGRSKMATKRRRQILTGLIDGLRKRAKWMSSTFGGEHYRVLMK